tara:strand:- start:121 stop:666 length:546 start_codon:yes stop_codon:yes gene_type:complete
MATQEGMFYNDNNYPKISKIKNRICKIDNQVVMRVSRTVTTKHEEVEYYPMPEDLLLTHPHKLYDIEIIDRNYLRYKPTWYNKDWVQIKPLQKNEFDERDKRKISTTTSKWKFQIVKMNFLDTCKKLMHDMENSVNNMYDADYLSIGEYLKEYFYNTKHEETYQSDEISSDETYKIFQDIL